MAATFRRMLPVAADVLLAESLLFKADVVALAGRVVEVSRVVAFAARVALGARVTSDVESSLLVVVVMGDEVTVD